MPDAQTNKWRDFRSAVQQHRTDARRAAEHYRFGIAGSPASTSWETSCSSAWAAVASSRRSPSPSPGNALFPNSLSDSSWCWASCWRWRAVVASRNYAVKSALALSVAREIYEIVRRFTALRARPTRASTTLRARQELDRLLDRLAEVTLRFGGCRHRGCGRGREGVASVPSFAARIFRLFRPQRPLDNPASGVRGPAAPAAGHPHVGSAGSSIYA